MAAPSTPTGFIAQTGNRQNYISWDITPTATGYKVQRSLDGVNYSNLASPTANAYLDTAVTVGMQYWYKVQASNGDGDSAATSAESVVPTPTSEMSLGQIRLYAQQRSDLVGSQFITVPEWNAYINQSMFELYDLLVTKFEDYYVATPAQFATNGVDVQYSLPDGDLSFINGLTGQSGYIAPPFYKLLGVDLGVNNANNAWVTLNKFNFANRNEYVYPNSNSTIYGVFNMQYRMLGDKIEFIPVPVGNQNVRLWYVPRLLQLLKDTDYTSTGISGWLEYVIVDAAIKAMQKQQQDTQLLVLQKMALVRRIEDTAANRDAGKPDTIQNTRGNSWGSSDGFGWSGPRGGW